MIPNLPHGVSDNDYDPIGGFDEDAEQCSLCDTEIYPEEPCHTVNGDAVCGDCILNCAHCGEPLDDDHDCELEAA